MLWQFLLPCRPEARHCLFRQLFSLTRRAGFYKMGDNDAVIEINPDVILRQAPDGMHLMDSLLALSITELPEFVFLDINMPGKTGLECLQGIRNLEGSLKEVNIVMLSTSSDPENIRRASKLGATFYAVKPNCFERLKSLLEDVLSMDLVGAGEGNKKFLLV